MKKFALFLSLFLLSSCSSNNLILKMENGEKYIIDKSLVKYQIFGINNLIEIINKKENERIQNIIEQQKEDDKLISQENINNELKKQIVSSQKLIDNNCGQWYRPELCNKGMDQLDKNNELLKKGKKIIKKINLNNENLIKEEKNKKRELINELANSNYAENHFVRLIYNSTYIDVNKDKTVIPAKTIYCFNPVLQENFYLTWQKYSKVRKKQLTFIDTMVCKKYSIFK